MMRLLVVLLLILLSSPAVAQETAKSLQWWEVAAGIIAIPAGLLGLLVAYATMKKANLESRKIELEIRAAEAKLAEQPAAAAEAQRVASSLFAPFIESNRTSHFLLRFAIIFLLLQFWGVIERLFDGFVLGVYLAMLGLGWDMNSSPVLAGIFGVADQGMRLGWIAIILFFGVPLYRDITKHLGFRLFSRSPTS